jgi:Right handed beta helix region
MSKFTLFPFAAATLLVLAAGAGPARAQAPDGLIIRSFVSAGGNDAHGCTRPAPCRTLSAALAKTAAGGTISIIDAGGYGTVTIDKAINIINDGAGTASILVPQGEIGVFVKDPFYEARVYLRGLTIEGANVGSTGVFVNGARAVSVENCVIRNLFGGILFSPESSNVASNKPFMAQSALTVANTTIADIGGVAVLIAPGDIGVVKAALRGVRVFNNLEMGIQVLGGASRQPIDVAISDSLVTQNGQGIVANTSTAQAPVKVMVTGSTVAHSFFTGLQASDRPPDPGQQDIKSTAEIWIGQSTVFGNTTGVEASGGALLRSFGDNYIAGNQTDGTFAATVPRR